MSTLRTVSNKLRDFGRKLAGNRVFDLYIKYNGIKLLTTATLVPVALIMGKDAFENYVMDQTSQKGGMLPSNMPIIDDPLVGTYLKLAGLTSVSALTPQTLVPLGVAMLLYDVYERSQSGGQKGGAELMKYVKSVWGNRVLDIFVKYQGLKTLTSATLVPFALLMGRDVLEDILRSDQAGGSPIPDDLPILDDPLVGNYLKLAGVSTLALSAETLLPLGLVAVLYHLYFEK
jgi:hypothetical protein